MSKENKALQFRAQGLTEEQRKKIADQILADALKLDDYVSRDVFRAAKKIMEHKQ